MDSLSSPFLHVEVSNTANTVPFPKDGLEYVKNVIIERKQHADTVSVNVYDTVMNNYQTVYADVLPKTVPSPDVLLPTKEWQIIQESDFSKVRCRLSSLRNEKDVWRSPVTAPPISLDKSLTLWRDFLKSNNPLLSIVLPMKQANLEFAFDVLVQSLAEIIPGNGIERRCGQWIYAILAAFKLPLTPDGAHSLREMARVCSRIRSNISPEEENAKNIAAPFNLFICLIAKYFGQQDLAD